jgi:hypothetical protein
MGISWPSQRNRINRDAVLAEVVQGVFITNTPGGRQEMTCLPLEFLNGWLFGINASRVRDDVRPRLIRYQRECYQALHEAFQEGRLSVAGPGVTELAQQDTPAAQAYRHAQALVRLARQQLILEAQVDAHGAQLDDHARRLEELEATLGDPERTITPAQATRISQAVKAIAMKLGARSGRNEYGGVYGELYRRFQIPTYRELPSARFDEAMDWLGEWWAQVADSDEIPF